MDSLCLQTGIHGIAPPISVGGGIDVRPNPNQVSAMGRSTLEKSTTGPKKKTPFSGFSFKYPLKSLWPGKVRGGYDGLALDDAVLVENGEVKAGDEGDYGTVGSEGQSENWVLKILHARSLWREEQGKKIAGHMKSNQEEKDVVGVGVANDKRNESNGHDPNCEESEGCDFCRIEDDDEENEAEFNRDSFTQMLRRVSLADARLYAQMSYLGNLAYDVSKIKSGNLLRRYGLHYVISSIDKRELAAKAEKKQETPEVQVAERNPEGDNEGKNYENHRNKMSASAAYHIAASAASYLYSHTRSILPFNSLNTEDGKDLANESGGMINSEMANLMATTDSVTAVVAAKEEVKQAVADDLNSKHSSPCEWFICDDDRSSTRIFAIQGSESLSSWQANLLFEPIKFEGLDVHVHRGIYEAAKGIYQQVLPEVHEHLKSHGGLATLRFSGHSLGGSLALLINLMLLIRNEVPVSSLLPVITFGAPSVMCGGDNLLCKLGLPRKHVQAIMMHRDIVPRAFSCNYPNHVAEFLKAVNGNFRNHPCLNNQKLLYAPMGELLILQPDEKLSPNLDLLPSGAGLYLLSCGTNNAKKQLRAAKTLFFNSPHPLEVLSDRSSYGSDGSIQRDHDMNSYLKSVRGVIRQELNDIRKANRAYRDKVWWPLLTTRSVNAGILVGRSVVSINKGEKQSNFSGIMQTGRDSLKRFSRFVASQHMRLFVVLLFPARLLVLGTFSVFSFR